MKVINEAADKFKDKQAEVIEALLDLLRLINEQESSMFEKDCEIRGRSKELSAEEEKNERDLMWENYRSNVKNIVEGRCTARLIRRGYARSFGTKPMYGYINGDCTAIFRMKSQKKAIVEFVLDTKGKERFLHAFTMVQSGGKWLADTFTFGSSKKIFREKTHI